MINKTLYIQVKSDKGKERRQKLFHLSEDYGGYENRFLYRMQNVSQDNTLSDTIGQTHYKMYH
jgi:hypothetical protein